MSPVLHDELYTALEKFPGEFASILVEMLKTNRKPLRWRQYRLTTNILEMLHAKWEGDLASQVQTWVDKVKTGFWPKDLLAIRLTLGVFFNWDPTQLGKGRVSPQEATLMQTLRSGGLSLCKIGWLLNRDEGTVAKFTEK